jgi:VanZ family protein
MFGKLAKIAAWASVGFIVYATLVPVEMRPTLGEIGANYERFAGYALASALLALAYPRHPLRVGILVVAIAIVLEFAQLAIPDRDARVVDALVKVVGGMAGMLAAALWNRHVFRQSLADAKAPAR